MLRPRSLVATCLLALTLAMPAVASAKGVVRAPLPTAARTKVARKVRDPRIERYRQHYLRKKARGRLGVMSPKKARAEREIGQLAGELNRALKARPAKKPVLIILEGPDGAGKSSTIRRLLPAFEGARKVDVAHFGAPPPGADEVQVMMHYLDKVPVQGRVTIWDRSWYGQTVYEEDGSIRPSTKRAKQAIRDIRNLEGLLANKVDIVKIYLDVSAERQAQTLGKREALAPEKLGDPDYLAYEQHDQVRELARHAQKNTGKSAPWHVIKFDDRAAGRKKLLQTLQSELIRD